MISCCPLEGLISDAKMALKINKKPKATFIVNPLLHGICALPSWVVQSCRLHFTGGFLGSGHMILQCENVRWRWARGSRRHNRYGSYYQALRGDLLCVQPYDSLEQHQQVHACWRANPTVFNLINSVNGVGCKRSSWEVVMWGRCFHCFPQFHSVYQVIFLPACLARLH